MSNNPSIRDDAEFQRVRTENLVGEFRSFLYHMSHGSFYYGYVRHDQVFGYDDIRRLNAYARLFFLTRARCNYLSLFKMPSTSFFEDDEYQTDSLCNTLENFLNGDDDIPF